MAKLNRKGIINDVKSICENYKCTIIQVQEVISSYIEQEEKNLKEIQDLENQIKELNNKLSALKVGKQIKTKQK